MDLATGGGPAKVGWPAHSSDGAQLVHGLAVRAYALSCVDRAALLNAIALALQVVAVQLALKPSSQSPAAPVIFGVWCSQSCMLAGPDGGDGVIASIQAGLGRYAGELVVAVMWKRVLRVATRVDLRKFESARFYDRLQRVQANAATRPYQITYGLLATMGALAASAGLVVAIVLVHPALLPLLLVGGVRCCSRADDKASWSSTSWLGRPNRCDCGPT